MANLFSNFNKKKYLILTYIFFYILLPLLLVLFYVYNLSIVKLPIFSNNEIIYFNKKTTEVNNSSLLPKNGISVNKVVPIPINNFEIIKLFNEKLGLLKYFVSDINFCGVNNNKIILNGENKTEQYKKDVKDAGSLSVFDSSNPDKSILYIEIGDKVCKKYSLDKFLIDHYQINWKAPIAYIEKSEGKDFQEISLNASESLFYIRPSYLFYLVFSLLIFYPFYVGILKLYQSVIIDFIKILKLP